jgi:hypothetical protein
MTIFANFGKASVCKTLAHELWQHAKLANSWLFTIYVVMINNHKK